MADIPTDYGRATLVMVSGYDRTRVHASRLVRGESRPLAFSIKGAVPKARTIASARFQCDDGSTLAMSNARLSDDKRIAAVDLRAAWAGCAMVKCTMTLDNGEVLAQLAAVSVLDGACFTDGTSFTGPSDLTVTA